MPFGQPKRASQEGAGIRNCAEADSTGKSVLADTVLFFLPWGSISVSRVASVVTVEVPKFQAQLNNTAAFGMSDSAWQCLPNSAWQNYLMSFYIQYTKSFRPAIAG